MPDPCKAEHSVEDPPHAGLPDSLVFGSTEVMQAVKSLYAKVAATSAPILITGETGTGKEIVARCIHAHSPWAGNPFLKLNCPILRGAPADSDFWEEVLRRLAPPSFTDRDQRGASPQTTLFLDEIALLDLTLQVRLLEKLQQRSPLQASLPGGTTLEVRIISATSHQLEQEVRAGHFLRELFYLLTLIVLPLSPLRERREDIPALVAHLLDRHSRQFQAHPPPLPRRILHLMSEYNWPGNIRELENLIVRYVVQGSEDSLMADLNEFPSTPPASGILPGGRAPDKDNVRQAVRELEQRVIRKVLEEHQGNRKQSARALNISYRALLYKIKAAGVPPKRAMQEGSRTASQPEEAAITRGAEESID